MCQLHLRVLALALGAARCATFAEAHAFLREPPARNIVDPSGSGYCPHCGNGGSRAAPGSTCGDGNQWPVGETGEDYYLRAAGPPQRTYAPGQHVQLTVSMNVPHMGHHEFFVCDRPVTAEEGAVECFQRWPLHRVSPLEVYQDCEVDDDREDCQPIDPKHPGRWYHKPGKAEHVITYRIPEGLKCTRCTLLWFWPTANSRAYDEVGYSCFQKRLNQLGWTAFNFCGWACSDALCPDPDLYEPPASPLAPDHDAGKAVEEFRNCADIAVVGDAADSGSATTAGPTRTVSLQTTFPPVAMSCAPVADCGAHAWCDMGLLSSHCAAHRVADCPAPFCFPMPGGGATTLPTMGPTTPAATPAPDTTKPNSGVGCVAAAGKGESNGVGDKDCAKCSEGYQWWPCNEPELCVCAV